MALAYVGPQSDFSRGPGGSSATVACSGLAGLQPMVTLWDWENNRKRGRC